MQMREFTGLNISLFLLALEGVLKVQCGVSLICSRILLILEGSFRGSRHGKACGSICVLKNAKRHH
jgi:hypothetical protein